ncbi:hypothetical protein DFQ14_101501 [Halopolyspora algeriensis]|uniref:PIN domain-containing protein n=1 Tax=Halopolyspora algeriensis TaxID=1500506 RepID=A0A368VYT6_9ACTN|nr:hypothetical protein [Halopolyspora algeriensis]RCW47157.1 hypothetical protein DFQ14_101501 [Halopolyspora algeriensis]TQM48243.1 hypothetical protein FHU43_3207 [Halopolyspora algeriensis]
MDGDLHAQPEKPLAALAEANGLIVASADSGFAKFDDVKWISPLFGPG